MSSSFHCVFTFFLQPRDSQPELGALAFVTEASCSTACLRRCRFPERAGELSAGPFVRGQVCMEKGLSVPRRPVRCFTDFVPGRGMSKEISPNASGSP